MSFTYVGPCVSGRSGSSDGRLGRCPSPGVDSPAEGPPSVAVGRPPTGTAATNEVCSTCAADGPGPANHTRFTLFVLHACLPKSNAYFFPYRDRLWASHVKQSLQGNVQQECYVREARERKHPPEVGVEDAGWPGRGCGGSPPGLGTVPGEPRPHTQPNGRQGAASGPGKLPGGCPKLPI